MNRTTVITLMPRTDLNVKMNVDLQSADTLDTLEQLQTQQSLDSDFNGPDQSIENIFSIS